LKTLSLYIHIPWCIKKCPYCDFNSHALVSTAPETAYVNALLNDLQSTLKQYSEVKQRLLTSIFIGGGTPSLFSAIAIDQLLTGIAQQLTFSNTIEVTLEANPGACESKQFSDYRRLGINRLSIGVQSFQPYLLKQLGRVHSANEALAAIEIAKEAGFDNLNLDLMFGLPEQTAQQMIADIQTAIYYQPTHISYYQLTLEPNTLFYQFPPPLPTDEMIYHTHQQSQHLLAEAGYKQYEISAYAKPSKRCQHNLNYWQFGDYLGIGAGAHGKLTLSPSHRIIRTLKCKHPDAYLKNQAATTTSVLTTDLPLEYLINQLRLRQGFSQDDYCSRTGLPLQSLEPALSACIEQGLLIAQDQQYICSTKGWYFIDTILEKFIP